MTNRRWLAIAIAITLACFAPMRAIATPPFADELEQLSETLGSLQFLAELCDDEEQPWRNEMEAILAVAEGTDDWRQRLTDRYNLGYISFAAAYRNCTSAARAAIDLYRTRGAALAAYIASEFGTPDPLPPIDQDR